MANVYDRFDDPSAGGGTSPNPYDQFDEPATLAAPAVVPANPYDQFDADQPIATSTAPTAPSATVNPYDQFTPPPVVKPPPPAEGFFEELGASYQRSMASPGVASALDLMGLQVGTMDPVKFAKEQAAMQRQVALAPASSAGTGAASYLDPGKYGSIIGQAIPQFGEVGLWTLPGTVGGPAGAIGASSTAAGLLDMSNSFIQRLQEKYKVDTKNDTELYLAITNPEMFNDAFWYAATRAGAIGAISAATGGLAGKFLPKVLPGEVIGATTNSAGVSTALHAPRTLLQKTGLGAVATAAATASGAVEETGAQVASTGGVENWWDVVDEALMGTLTSAPSIAAPGLGRAAHGPKGIFARAPKIDPNEGPPHTIDYFDAQGDRQSELVEGRNVQSFIRGLPEQGAAFIRATPEAAQQPEAPIAYTIGPNGSVELTDHRVGPDGGNPNIQTTNNLIERLRLAAGVEVDPTRTDLLDPGVSQDPASWHHNASLHTGRSPVEDRLIIALGRMQRTARDQPVSFARVLQEVSHGLLETNWERWRAAGQMPRAPANPSMMPPLVIGDSFVGTTAGIRRRGPASTLQPGYKYHSFDLTSDGQTVGSLNISENDHQPGEVHVNWIGVDDTMGRNFGHYFGFKGTRDILRAIKKEFPHATKITGYRVSGARGRAGHAGHAETAFSGEQVAGTPLELVRYNLPTDIGSRTINLAEGRDANGRRTLVVQTDDPMTGPHARKVLEHAKAEGYDSIAFAPDSELGALLQTEADTSAEAQTVNVLFDAPQTLGVLEIERSPNAVVELSSIPHTETAFAAGEPYATPRFDAEAVTNFMARMDKIVREFARLFHISQAVVLEIVDDLPPGKSARVVYTFDAAPLSEPARIQVMPERAASLAKLALDVGHEFGHILLYDKLYNAPTRTLTAILTEYATFWNNLTERNAAGMQHRQIALDRLAPAELSTIYNSENRTSGLRYDLDDAAEYWGGFEEWFAAQFGRWMTTQPKPLTVVDRFFSSLAKTFKRLLERLWRSTSLRFDPPTAVKTYLDAFLEEVNPGAFKTLYDQIETQTRLANGEALRRFGAAYVEPVPQTAATGPSREIALRLFGGTDNRVVDPDTGAVTYRVEENATYRRGRKKTALEILQGQAAISDKIFTLYTGGIGIYQLAQRNLHIPGLQRFNAFLQEADAFAKSIMNRAIGTVKLSEKLSTDMTLRLHLALDDYGQMRYRSPGEIRRNLKRFPTEAELTAIWDQHELSPQARRVFQAQRGDYAWALDLMEQELRDEVARQYTGLDPSSRLLAQARALQAIDAEMAALRKAPYLPQMRWGLHTVTVYGSDGRTLWFAQDETTKQQTQTYNAVKELYPGHDVIRGYLSEDVVPLMGIPRPLLQRLKENGGFSPTQLAYIEDLAYELAPVHSFKHRMQTKENIAGYAKDFSRAYAAYFLQFANYMAKAKWGDQLRDAVTEVQEQGRYMPDDTKSWQDMFGLYKPRGTKRTRIGNEMADHLRDWLDPKADFWFIKGVSFFVALGYAPLAALVNLTGILTNSYGIMAEGFGDISAGQHLGKASARFARHRTKLDAPLIDHQMTMRQVLTEEGTINESFAANLAAIAEGRNLLEQVSTKRAARGFYWLLEKSSLMFQYTEMTVRIVTADAAYTAALEQPTAKFVLDSIESERVLFDRLVMTGRMSPTQAAATVTAKRAVHNSQGIYAQWARPRFMRGKKGTLFQFKAFQQNLLWNLWNHKQGAVRSLLVFGLLGGIMAEPGMEDISDILKWLARMIFGKDFDLERDARDTMVTWAHTDPGLFLHGTASKGFGIPALLDLAGKVTGYGDVPFPETDLSGKISVGSLSPIPLSLFLTPSDNPDEAVGKMAERAGGAALGLGFTLYRALTDVKNQDHWLRLIPAAIRNVPKGWEALQTGELRDPYGGAIIKFDPRDTEQMMEIIAYSLGASPSRLVLEQSADRETREVVAFWDMRQQALLRQLAEAVKSDDSEERDSVIQSIKDFNAMLPELMKSKRITATSARSSVQNRLRREEMREQNVPYRRQDRPLADRIHGLYFPDAEEVQTLK